MQNGIKMIYSTLMRINMRRTLLKFIVAVLAITALSGFALVRYTHRTPAHATSNQLVLHDTTGAWSASFTKGARTVTMAGPSRVFSESNSTTATVTSTTWVRLYPRPFDGNVDQAWLKQAQDNNTKRVPDVLQVAMQYIDGAPTIKDASGATIAGDASYGPLLPDEKHAEGSDFNDYLGIDQTYAGSDGSVDTAEKTQLGDLDCSGFQRMVWGYRSGMPLSLQPNGTSIPRRSYQIFDAGPGIITIPNTGKQVTDLSALQVGDLVFHDASTNDGTQIDHVGIYLGIDSNGNHRFISSRKTANGPTLGDIGGKSILEGKGLYATSFRGARRF
jgi:cell wall-associated NlpC family hydrolase